MIRVMEDTNLSQDDMERQMQEMVDKDLEYYKVGEWVHPKLYNPERIVENSWIHISQTLWFRKRSSDYGVIELNFVEPRGYYLEGYTQEAVISKDREGNLTHWNYTSKYHDTICRIKKTSLKTPDKQVIFTPRGEEDNEMKFIKNERGILVPYFGEIL